jgi:hypothetical protein
MCLETDRFALWIYEEIANRPDILAEERWLSSVDGLYAADSVVCKNTFNMDFTGNDRKGRLPKGSERAALSTSRSSEWHVDFIEFARG